MNKYYIHCNSCGAQIDGFGQWFAHRQKCPKCGSNHADVVYPYGFEKLIQQVQSVNFKPESVWGYFDFLPLLDREHIVSAGGEGIRPIDQWKFMEGFAKEKYNIDIKVYAHRHDTHKATGTFKDLAGTVVASVMKEHGQDTFVAASTGNIGVAYARYLAAAGINLYLFLPETSIKSQEAEISAYGQNVIRVDGDYAYAKKMGKQFADENGFLYTAGNLDPMRLEAKKTMVYEWMRLLPEMPTVFMQAVSGGSGPLGIAKAVNELQGYDVAMPRFILPQPERCAPMAQAWEKAKAGNFPEGWLHDYPVWENPVTSIPTLSTGNPKAYPTLAPLVKDSQGEITSSQETKAVDVARLVAYETQSKIGPAAALTVVGFFESLRKKEIRDGDVVMLNIGEGMARSPEFMAQLAYTTQNITRLDEVKKHRKEAFHDIIWNAVAEI